MEHQVIKLEYDLLDWDELDENEKELITCAKQATTTAYAPYSNFKVGCAVRLANNEIIIGSNQENVAYPSGLCAERVALFTAGTKKEKVESIAITTFPCGACRQVMMEFQQNTKKEISVLILSNEKIIRTCVRVLLPLDFHIF